MGWPPEPSEKRVPESRPSSGSFHHSTSAEALEARLGTGPKGSGKNPWAKASPASSNNASPDTAGTPWVWWSRASLAFPATNARWGPASVGCLRPFGPSVFASSHGNIISQASSPQILVPSCLLILLRACLSVALLTTTNVAYRTMPGAILRKSRDWPWSETNSQ